MEHVNITQTAGLMPIAVQRMTKQRKAIINMLINSVDHPTAEEIHAAVKEELPDISIGTVYRNLQILLSEGLIQEISASHSGSRFDANKVPHSHFFCRSCGRVYDVPSCGEISISPEMQAKIPGKLDFHRTDFFGICSDCMNSQFKD